MSTLGRLLTAMVTPFDASGELDCQQAKRLAKALTGSGSDGLVLSGTTGESPTLTRDEKVRLFAEVRSAVDQPLVANTGTYSTRESIALTRETERLGVDAILLVVPYYSKPTQEGLFQHFRSIAESTRLPCILYNVPSRTVVSLSADTVIRLSQVDNIMGIKEASGNLEQVAKIVQSVKRDFLVYSGNDSDTLPIMELGGYGVISVVSHLVGVQIRQMIDRLLEGKKEEAEEIHQRLLPLMNAMFVISNPMPLKYALNHIGFGVGKPRLPLTEPDEKSRAIIEATLRECHIDLPVPDLEMKGKETRP